MTGPTLAGTTDVLAALPEPATVDWAAVAKRAEAWGTVARGQRVYWDADRQAWIPWIVPPMS